MNKKVIKYISMILFFILIFSIVVIGVGFKRTLEISNKENKKIVEQAIYQAVVSYYALNGVYPYSYEVLKEESGLQVNENLYFINYNIFASNIMPDITVIER